ncbi:MFS transporter [Rhodopseudomonas sp.]|uniref:MFS transporter n=1 Tax=Rhodopseudomonas sp. TaxID=1078 RepID=UPI003B3AE300
MTPSATSAPVQKPGFVEFVCLVAALMAMNALAIDSMLPALPHIGQDLAVRSPNGVQWVVTAYLLGFGGAQLAYGPLADRFGRKPVMIIPQLIALTLTYPSFLWIVADPGPASLLFGFGVLSMIGSLPFTAFYATFTEALPQQIRGGVFAIVYAVAIASFGGTAQLVVTWLLHVSGNPLAPAWYLLLAAAVGLGAMTLMPETAPVKVGNRERN